MSVKKGERVNLRPIEEKDIEWLRESRNKYKDHFFDSSEISYEQQRMWYSSYKEAGTDRMYIIELKDATPIGTIAIYDIDIGRRMAKFGRFLLIEDYRGKGYAEEAAKLCVDIAINDMRLFKLKVEVFLENLDAIAIYARTGFKTGKPIIVLEKVAYEQNLQKPLVLGEY